MTQKYIPVEWTDETPTQPGTLINKARLDQMQSAHHFADGFEEVDAIPTEDPGTEYHKVVYCTADSTFYRWDGAQWTADIDDDTKRLLLEHEADHANPHQVTKAQVGLGNADNTSDQNKPVSTAQAAAIKLVQDYLDAHEANHSNPHQVTKAQVGLGNADNTADLDKPISTATQTALDGKLADSQLVTSWGGTPSDSKIPSEKLAKDTLDTKAPITALTDGSVTKLGTANVGSDTLPIKLVGGSPTPVADALAKDSTVVHNTGTETIDGSKTFSSIIYHSQSGNQYDLVGIRSDIDITALTGTSYKNILKEQDKNGLVFASISSRIYTDQSSKAFLTTLSAGNVGQTSEIATVATLDAYAPMVRTTGAQTIAGAKALITSSQINRNWRTIIESTSNTRGWVKMFRLKQTGNTMVHVEGISTGSQAPHNVHFEFIQFSDRVATPLLIQLTSDVKAMVSAANFAVAPATVDGVAYLDYYINYQANAYAGLHITVDFKSRNEGAKTLDDATITYYTNTAEDPTGIAGVAYGSVGTTYALLQSIAGGSTPSAAEDIATIATLDSYAPMVRTTGNQTIGGTKTFTSYPKGIGPVTTSINDQQTPNHVLICKFQGLFNGANMRIIVDTIHGQFVITASYYNGFTLNAYYIGSGNHAYTDVHIYQKDGDYYLIIDNSVWNTTFRAYTQCTGNFGQTQNYDYLDYSVMALLANLDDYTLSVTASNGGTIR